MKVRSIIFSAIFFLTSLNCFAITYEIIGPCSDRPLYSGSIKIADLAKESVGKVSLSIFTQRKISFAGNESGFTSILGTPVGIDSIEVISESKMRAHGWCYSVNNVGPDVTPNDYFFGSQSDKLVWFYGHSTFENNQWIDFCVPTYTVKPAQFCTK